jgi:hypothetical protein
MILCGLKLDEVEGEDTFGASRILDQLFCKKYIEVSAISQLRHRDVFNEALKAVYKQKLRKTNPRDSRRTSGGSGKKKDCTLF